MEQTQKSNRNKVCAKPEFRKQIFKNQTKSKKFWNKPRSRTEPKLVQAQNSEQIQKFKHKKILNKLESRTERKFLEFNDYLTKIKRFPPLFRRCFWGRCRLSIFYIISWVHLNSSAEKLFLKPTKFEFYKKLNAFNPSLKGFFGDPRGLIHFFTSLCVSRSNLAE